jgi:hypothetical protein
MLDQAAPIRDITRPERNASPPTAQNIGQWRADCAVS